jgi:hypothetical protein
MGHHLTVNVMSCTLVLPIMQAKELCMQRLISSVRAEKSTFSQMHHIWHETVFLIQEVESALGNYGTMRNSYCGSILLNCIFPI